MSYSKAERDVSTPHSKAFSEPTEGACKSRKSGIEASRRAEDLQLQSGTWGRPGKTRPGCPRVISYPKLIPMLPTVLSLQQVQLKLHLKVVRLNQEQQTRTHTRVGANGQAKMVITRPKVLCDGAKTTCVLLLQRARVQVLRMLANPIHWGQFIPNDASELPDVPPIEVNGRELSEKRGLTDRALRNHIAQLIKTGAIVRKKFRGSRASFHVWMNPELIWETPPKAAEVAKTSSGCNTQSHDFFTPNGIKVPHTEVLESLETPEREITNVDKFGMGLPSITGSGNFFPRNPSLETEARNCGAGKRKKYGAGGAAATDTSKPQRVGEEVRDLIKLKKMNFVTEFWEAAKALVYPGRKWGTEQERLAQNAIWTGVYHSFNNYDTHDWKAIHCSLLQRLQLVRNHLQLHPERYAPLPYSQHKPGAGYFDLQNVRGFRGTEAWLKNVRKRNQSLKVERALRLAMNEVGQRNAIDRASGPQIRTNERVRTQSIVQLVRYHERILTGLGNASALDRFYAKVANRVSKSTFKTISPK